MAVFDKIKEFYKSNTLASMEAAYQRGYTEFGASGLLNPEQSAWAGASPPNWRELTDSTTGTVIGAGDDYLEEFYGVLLETFRAVADDRKSIAANAGIVKFLDKYYGAAKLFEPFTIDYGHPALTANLGTRVPPAGIIGAIAANDEIRMQMGMTSANFEAFLDEIAADHSKLNKKKTRETFQTALTALRQNQGNIRKSYDELKNWLDYSNKTGLTAADKASADLRIQESINNLIYAGVTNLGTFVLDTLDVRSLNKKRRTNMATAADAARNASTGLITDAQNIDKVLKNDIRSAPPRTPDLDLRVNDILKTFAESKDIRDAFLPKMDYEYANAISDAVSKTDYKDGKNKIAPHYADKKLVFDRARALVKEISDNYLGKYLSKAKREQMPATARAIFDEIEAQKIKPTDGLAKILENADKIKGKLPALATADFGFMVDSLKALSGTAQFKKALKSGKSMRNLVESVADMVAEEKDEKKRAEKEERAKKLHFVLNGLSYGLMTSSRRNELKKADFDILKGTSLEKVANGMFTKAIGKTFKFTFFAAFELANMGKNKLRGMNAEFGPTTMQTQAVIQAQNYVAANPAMTLATYRSDADAARADYEAAAKTGEKKADQLKKRWQAAELRVQAKERGDDRALGGGATKQTPLDAKLRLMAHWDFVHGGKTSDFSLTNHSRAEKAYHNKIIPGLNKSAYQIKLEEHLGSWNRGMAA